MGKFYVVKCNLGQVKCQRRLLTNSLPQREYRLATAIMQGCLSGFYSLALNLKSFCIFFTAGWISSTLLPVHASPRLSEKSFILFIQYPPDKGLFLVEWQQILQPKNGCCTGTNQRCQEDPLGTDLLKNCEFQLTSIWGRLQK